MVERIKIVWKNRYKIIEGIYRTYFPNKFVAAVAESRLNICESNACGYFDLVGRSEKCLIKGRSCCSGCGCNTDYKVHSLSSYCALKDMGKVPLWDSIMTQEQEDEFKKKHDLK